jgi:hypothetical protein
MIHSAPRICVSCLREESNGGRAAPQAAPMAKKRNAGRVPPSPPMETASVPSPPAAPTAAAPYPTLRFAAIPIVLLLVAFTCQFLAELVPNGVTAGSLIVAAEAKAASESHRCHGSCKGMGCPAGWTTGHSPDDLCKCICVRIDPSATTPWDEERRRKAAEKQHTPGIAGLGPKEGGWSSVAFAPKGLVEGAAVSPAIAVGEEAPRVENHAADNHAETPDSIG